MSRPIALVTCGQTPVHPLGTGPGTLVSEGMARYWKFPLEPVAQARGFAASAWRATVWPGAPAPGRYAAFLTDIKTGEYIEDLACLHRGPCSGRVVAWARLSTTADRPARYRALWQTCSLTCNHDLAACVR